MHWPSHNYFYLRTIHVGCMCNGRCREENILIVYCVLFICTAKQIMHPCNANSF